jgi:hypothetical protein
MGRELRGDLQAHGLRLALDGAVDADVASRLADGLLTGSAAARAEAEQVLASRGLTLDQATARAAAMKSEVADFNRAVGAAAGECLRQSNRIWRRLQQSRTWKDSAQRFVSQQFRRQRAADEKIRRLEVEGLRDSLMKARVSHPAALRPWPATVMTPQEDADADGPPTPSGPVFQPIPEPSFERPDWVASHAQLMDELPSVAGKADDDQLGGDEEVLYYLHLLSLYPEDVLQERLVRSAVQSRLELDQLQRELVEVVAAGLGTTLWETLRRLAPDADHGVLVARFRTDSAARETVARILASAGLTLVQLEARGVLRDIRMVLDRQRRLSEAQDQFLDVDKAFAERRASGMRAHSLIDRSQERLGR